MRVHLQAEIAERKLDLQRGSTNKKRKNFAREMAAGNDAHMKLRSVILLRGAHTDERDHPFQRIATRYSDRSRPVRRGC